jgi:hypothetical protein
VPGLAGPSRPPRSERSAHRVAQPGKVTS